MHPNAYGVYKNNSVNFASKEQMLLMLLDGAVKFAKRGKLAIQEKDIKIRRKNPVRTGDDSEPLVLLILLLGSGAITLCIRCFKGGNES